jgi:hypothetical protein
MMQNYVIQQVTNKIGQTLIVLEVGMTLNPRITHMRCIIIMPVKLGSVLERAPQNSDQIVLYIKNI